ncbi:MAG TPA: fluoride efflux transporter CrcB [Terriglobales bacterium]|nr:fluoride efflux transporter CrcB [Terriglobales bacterium]
MLILAVAFAGAIGALARWGISTWMLDWLGPRWPWGTLAVNCAGCFLLGLLMEEGSHLHWLSPNLRLTLAVGFIGTLTTFSTWELDTWKLARRGDMAWAAGNMALNVGLGFLLLWIGAAVANRLWPA